MLEPEIETSLRMLELLKVEDGAWRITRVLRAKQKVNLISGEEASSFKDANSPFPAAANFL